MLNDKVDFEKFEAPMDLTEILNTLRNIKTQTRIGDDVLKELLKNEIGKEMNE